ncbi:MAG: YbhB/YbcL family Raf kinase inhibitor-like protein [Candidatus Aenigmarchaeota archaeon]|nr:YbhB/YbcL family Raf kinase inhibitor-like protein [Candidatus Aenigmarchaeota archaeon]
MELSSPAFQNEGKIALKHAMPGIGGQNVSIPLAWKDAPAVTKSFALSIVDIHPVAREWVHWLVINIPSKANSIPEGASGKMPFACMELANSFGGMGYGGPQPPKGTGNHPYMVTLYALNVEKLSLPFSTSLSDFRKSLIKKILATASITGKYGR